MAQTVGYFENHPTLNEGPFVVVEANGWRIEAEVKGYRCPAMPDVTIFRLCNRRGTPLSKFNNRDEAAEICDWLNEQVREGFITLHSDGWWTSNVDFVAETMAE
jgi:hypothetical protein